MKQLILVTGLVAPLLVGVLIETAAAQNTSAIPNRSGFTLVASLGPGMQADTAVDEARVGVGGLNLGLGGFIRRDLALMARISGTTARYGDYDITQTSGVGGVTAQYWLNDRINVEGGPGLGFWTVDGADDQGFGLIVGAGYSVFHSTKTNVQIGAEWAPAFTDGGTVHNLGFNLGFQLL